MFFAARACGISDRFRRPSKLHALGGGVVGVVADYAARASGISDRFRNPSELHALGGGVGRVAADIQMTPAGLEPAIPGSVGRCLIHWATGPVISADVLESGARERTRFCHRSSVRL